MEAIPTDAAAILATGKEPAVARRNNREYLVGIGLLLIVVFLWTSSNFITQDLLEDGYDKPFWITYLNTASFTLYLLPYLIRRAAGVDKARDAGRAREGYQPIRSEGSHHEAEPASEEGLPPLTIKETANLAGWFCFLWFIANWALNAALGYTAVASATILSAMSGFFTLGIGRIFRVESLTLVKIGAVAASFGGVVLVSLSDSSEKPADPSDPVHGSGTFGPAPIVGDLLALLSALFYALYVILLKVRVREESRVDMQLFFGFVGLFNVLFSWPVGVLLHILRVERFEVPMSSKVVVVILINMGITLSSDYLYVLAMLKTTPLVVTIGLSLTMPLAVIGDFVLHKPVKFQVIMGAAVVLLSFVAVGIEDTRNKDETDLISGKPLDEEHAAGHGDMDDELSLDTQGISR